MDISVGNIFIHLIQYIIRRFFIMKINSKENKIGKIAKFACSGSDDGNGHPKIYLTIGENELTVNCPYCGKLFKKPS